MIKTDAFKSRADVKEYYKEVENIKLPIHIFFPEKHNTKDKIPAIICIHGGSWRGISDNSSWNGGTMLYQAKYYAKKGIAGVLISYRNFVQPEEREKKTVDVELYDLYEDCRDAVKFLRKNAQRFGIDPDKIAVMGDSAGGHLAACLGTLGNKNEKIVAGVVACNPITDLTDSQWIKYIVAEDKKHTIEKAREISPLYNITSQTVPFLLLHGSEDTVVSPKQSIGFYEKMLKNNNFCDIKIIRGAKHAFVVYGYTATEEQFNEAMAAADDFLTGLGFLI